MDDDRCGSGGNWLAKAIDLHRKQLTRRNCRQSETSSRPGTGWLPLTHFPPSVAHPRRWTTHWRTLNTNCNPIDLRCSTRAEYCRNAKIVCKSRTKVNEVMEIYLRLRIKSVMFGSASASSTPGSRQRNFGKVAMKSWLYAWNPHGIMLGRNTSHTIFSFKNRWTHYQKQIPEHCKIIPISDRCRTRRRPAGSHQNPLPYLCRSG